MKLILTCLPVAIIGYFILRAVYREIVSPHGDLNPLNHNQHVGFGDGDVGNNDRFSH